MLSAALATTGAVLLPGGAVAAGPEPDYLDLDRPEVRAAHHWLPMRIDPSGRGEAVPLRFGTSGTRPVTVTVSSTVGRVTVGATRQEASGSTVTLDLAPGQPGAVWVLPRSAGEPGQPGDRLIVAGPQGTMTVEAWIEPVGGRWEWAGPQHSPLDLKIVAVNAALLRTSTGKLQIEMYSPPRRTDSHGNPIRNPKSTDSPKEWWWDPTNMVNVESRYLDLSTMATHDRPVRVNLPGGATSENLFCGGLAHLPDGRLLHAGGHVHHDQNYGRHVYIYDQNAPNGWRWLPNAQFDKPRWYPTVTELPDGRMLIASGSTDAPWTEQDYWDHINNDYQILDPKTERWVDLGGGAVKATLIDETLLAMMRGPRQRLATYPWIFVLPGRSHTDTVLAMVETNMAWLYRYRSGQPLERAATAYPMATLGSRSYITNGSAVLLPIGPGKGPMTILAMGGQYEAETNHRNTSPDQPTTRTAEILVIDPDQEDLTLQPGWRPVGPLACSRLLCDATLLADGGVLVSGGSGRGWTDRNQDAANQSELYDAENKVFLPAATARTDRRYHSTALLLPDGSVFKAGSTGGFAEKENDAITWIHSHTDAERYWPGYTFRGPRPTITGLSGTTNEYGGTLTVTATGDSLDARTRAAIIRLGATTHNNNMDQRYVWLAVAGRTRKGPVWTIDATLPTNPAAAPPGDYMVVLVDSSGVPSPAELIQVQPN